MTSSGSRQRPTADTSVDTLDKSHGVTIFSNRERREVEVEMEVEVKVEAKAEVDEHQGTTMWMSTR